MQRRPLPSPPTNNQQVKEYTGAVKRGLNDYYVSPSEKGWRVRKAGGGSASANFESKAEAVSYARRLANSEADVVIYGKNGVVTVERRSTGLGRLHKKVVAASI